MGRRATAAKSKASNTSVASSSGHSDQGDSPSSLQQSPRVVVGTWLMPAVPAQWDNTSSIRDRLRDKFDLLVRVGAGGESENGHVEVSKENVILNFDALLPVCRMMGQHELTLPSIDNLIFAITEFYRISKAYRNGDHFYHTAWAFRRLLVYVKHNLYRDVPPQDWTC